MAIPAASGGSSTRFLSRAGLVIAGLAALFVPIPADVVERIYSTRVYAVVQHIATSASNLPPFALFDFFVVAVVVCWTFLASRNVRSSARWWASVLRILSRTAVWAAALYLIF